MALKERLMRDTRVGISCWLQAVTNCSQATLSASGSPSPANGLESCGLRFNSGFAGSYLSLTSLPSQQPITTQTYFFFLPFFPSFFPFPAFFFLLEPRTARMNLALS